MQIKSTRQLSRLLILPLITVMICACGIRGTDDERGTDIRVGALEERIQKLESQAASQAKSLEQMRDGQKTANEALASAQASQSCCDATNEKIDRIIQRQNR